MPELSTDWALVSLSPLSAPLVWVTVVLLCVGAGWITYHYRHATRPFLLITLRWLVALVLALMLIEPAVQLRTVRKKPDRVAFIVDRSASMALKAAHQIRYDHVLNVLKSTRPGLERLAQEHRIEWYDLEGAITEGTLLEPPKSEGSDLLQALETARRGGRLPLAGLVLISDGGDTAQLRAQTGALSSDVLDRLKALGAPVNTIDVNAGHVFRDIRVAEVLADDFAFVHNTIQVEVILEATDFADAVVPVTLKRDGAVVANQEVQLRTVPGADTQADSEVLQEASVVFSFKPDTIGEFVYSVEVPVLAGDNVAENNRRKFVLQVVRDKIRVLHVAGRPSWDERFLRQHLKENPNVDLVSFFILRTPNDNPQVPQSDLSLIPFPTRQLFTEKLSSFDVIIFQNFDYREYNMAQYLRDIANAVRGGLGFVMIGGQDSFGEAYIASELEDVLPLISTEQGMARGIIHPALTKAGSHHPITRLGPANAELWRMMPAWSDANLTLGVSAGATALVVDPERTVAGGARLPLIAVREVNKGRSLGIASSAMWRWRFSKGALGGPSERAYHRFWSNALRWLMRDPDHRRVQVIPERRRFGIAEPLAVDVRVLAEDYQPVAGASVRLRIVPQTEEGVAPKLVDGKTDEEGLWHYDGEALDEGAYKLEAEAFSGGKSLGKGEAMVIITPTSKEVKHGGAPRPDILRALAKAGRGAYLPLNNTFIDGLVLADPGLVEVARRRNVELWDNGMALAVVLLLMAGEWALRRRRGYL